MEEVIWAWLRCPGGSRLVTSTKASGGLRHSGIAIALQGSKGYFRVDVLLPKGSGSTANTSTPHCLHVAIFSLVSTVEVLVARGVSSGGGAFLTLENFPHFLLINLGSLDPEKRGWSTGSAIERTCCSSQSGDWGSKLQV